MATDNFGPAIEDFKRGGWIVSLFGAAGMLVRLLLTDKENKYWVWARKTFASSLVGVLTYFILHGITGIPAIYKAVILSLSGMMAPELFDLAINKLQRLTYEKPVPARKRKRPRRV